MVIFSLGMMVVGVVVVGVFIFGVVVGGCVFLFLLGVFGVVVVDGVGVVGW